MENKEALGFIVGAIKNKRKETISFINENGGTVKKGDSDIAIGKELSKVLSKGTPIVEKFTVAVKGHSFDPSVLISGISSVLSGGSQKAIAEQQGSDAITLALINAGIAKDKTSSAPIIIGAIAVFMIFALIGFLIYKKYK